MTGRQRDRLAMRVRSMEWRLDDLVKALRAAEVDGRVLTAMCEARQGLQGLLEGELAPGSLRARRG